MPSGKLAGRSIAPAGDERRAARQPVAPRRHRVAAPEIRVVDVARGVGRGPEQVVAADPDAMQPRPGVGQDLDLDRPAATDRHDGSGPAHGLPGVHGRTASAPRSIVANSFARREPRPDLAVGPLDADVGRGPPAQPEVDPAELAADVAAADRQLAPHRRSPTRTSSQPRSRRGSGPGSRSRSASQ